MRRVKSYTTNLLWTGGWDSTFRLLQLLFDGRTVVQPWYLLDEERESVSHELDSQERIRAELGALLPDSERLLPTRIVAVSSLGDAPDLTGMASRLKLGSQYEWLARFADEYELDGLELGVEDRPGRVQAMLRPLVAESDGPGGRSWRVVTERLAQPGTDPDHALFSMFAFPLLGVTKREMQEEACARGWDSLLALTWFCHSPKKGQPCGECTPCMVAIEEGFSERIPPLRRLRPRFRLLKRRLEKLIIPEVNGHVPATPRESASGSKHLTLQAEKN